MRDLLIREQIPHNLLETNFVCGELSRGKVRDNYVVDGKRIIVVTDRISAFDVVLTTLPYKGQVLNQLAAFWFDKTKRIAPNHVIDVPDPNVTVADDCTPIEVEMVVRAYLTGVTATSAWYNYERGVRNFCGNLLPDGMRKNQKFDQPVLTPSTKAAHGHDQSVSKQELVDMRVVGKDTLQEMEELSFRLFEFGARHAEKRGLILVDTKYEFGLRGSELVLIDEVHTPDSSRYWFKEEYEERFWKGVDQLSFDKEYVRRWLADEGFRGDGLVPQIPDDVRAEAARRYIEAYEMITGEQFKPSFGPVTERIRNRLEELGYL